MPQHWNPVWQGGSNRRDEVFIQSLLSPGADKHGLYLEAQCAIWNMWFLTNKSAPPYCYHQGRFTGSVRLLRHELSPSHTLKCAQHPEPAITWLLGCRSWGEMYWIQRVLYMAAAPVFLHFISVAADTQNKKSHGSRKAFAVSSDLQQSGWTPPNELLTIPILNLHCDRINSSFSPLILASCVIPFSLNQRMSPVYRSAGRKRHSIIWLDFRSVGFIPTWLRTPGRWKAPCGAAARNFPVFSICIIVVLILFRLVNLGFLSLEPHAIFEISARNDIPKLKRV